MSRASEEQKLILVQFLKKNKNVVAGKTSPNFTNKNIHEKWKTVAASLNSTGRPYKDWKNWRKTWQDLYSRVKAKAARINRSTNQTGGGPPSDEKLTTFEQDIVDTFIKPVVVEGDSLIKESVCNFHANDTTTSMISNSSGAIVHPIILNPVDEVDIEVINIDEVTKIPPTQPTTSKNLTRTGSAASEIVKKGKKRTAEESRAEYAEYLNKKLKIKKDYYDAKIEHLRQQTVLMEQQLIINTQLLELKKLKYSSN
ncbi:uncharacterized protein LOC116177740 [Photinus pyralis]|nr:uncharacterized protein LOC116177740 [Photinus pyralis]